MKATFANVSLLLFSLACCALADEKLSDAAIKQKLLGYWAGPRWAWLYKADGSKVGVNTAYKNKWDVKDGAYYEEGFRCEIVSLTDKQFTYREGKGTTTLTRITKKQAEKEGWR